MKKFILNPAAALAALVCLMALGLSAQETKPPKLDVQAIRSKMNTRSGTDYDNEKDVLAMTVTVQNNEMDRELKNLTCDVYIMGKGTETGNDNCLLRQSFPIQSIGPKKKIELKTQKAITEFDDHARAKFGYKYGGWIVVIKDESDTVIFTKSSKPSFLKNLDKVLNLQTGQVLESL